MRNTDVLAHSHTTCTGPRTLRGVATTVSIPPGRVAPTRRRRARLRGNPLHDVVRDDAPAAVVELSGSRVAVAGQVLHVFERHVLEQEVGHDEDNAEGMRADLGREARRLRRVSELGRVEICRQPGVQGRANGNLAVLPSLLVEPHDGARFGQAAILQLEPGHGAHAPRCRSACLGRPDPGGPGGSSCRWSRGAAGPGPA